MSMPLFSLTTVHLSIYSTRFHEALEGRTSNTGMDTTTISSSTTAPPSRVSSPKEISKVFACTPSLSRSNPDISNDPGSISANGDHERSTSLDSTASSAPRRQFTRRREELRQRQEKDAATISVSLSANTENTGEKVTTATTPSARQEESASPSPLPVSIRSMTSPSSLDSSPTSSDSVDATIARENAASSSSVSSSPPSAPPRYYFCDVCSQGCFTSFDDAEAHLLDAHMCHIPGYQLLRSVVGKLLDRDVWATVKEGKRKDGTLEACGRRVLEEGRRKDPGPERMQEAHRAREQLESVVQQWHPTARVYIFGSSVTFGIWDGMGDIDFTVVDESQLRAGTWPPPERNAVRSITELLRRAGFSYVNLEPISHARVPIIKHHASFPLRLEPSAVRRSIEAVAAEVAFDEEKECVSTTPSDSLSSLGNSQDMLDKGSAATTLEGKKAENEVPLLQKTLLISSEKTTKDLSFSLARRLEAEDIISRSVRYVLNGSATWEDRLLLEASIREAVGATSVQQVWWNRTRDLMNVTLDTTTSAIKAATCPLAVVSPTLRARIQPLHEDCRPELYNIDFDLSFRVFGIRNSQLLRRYLMQHPCARPGAMILKEWSKRSGVNNSVNGFLTSYAVAIMWLYFLLQKKVVKFVDPVKDVPASLEGCPMNPVYVPMVDSQWTKQEQALYATQGGELLVEFFYFYAVEFDWKNHVVSLNRPGITTKASLGWIDEGEGFFHYQQGGSNSHSHRSSMGSGESGSGAASLAPSIQTPRRHTVQYNFCIEDPYEENLNLGRHMGLTKTLRVQTEFYRGLLSLLKEGSKDSCVFPPPSLSRASGLSSFAFHGAKDSRNSKKEKSKTENEQSTKVEDEKNEESIGSLPNDNDVAPMEMEEKAFFTEGKGLVPPSTLAHKVLYRLMIVCLKEMTKSRRVYEEEMKKKDMEKSTLSSSAGSQRLSSTEAKKDPISSAVKEEKSEFVAQNSAVYEEAKPPSKYNTSPSILTPPASSSEDESVGPPTLSFSARDTVEASQITQENEVEEEGNVEEDVSWGGVPQEELRRALEFHAPIELKIGLKAWNWHQLLHRLGYKCHRNRVFPRREVGPSLLQHRRVSGGVGPGVAVTTQASTATTISSSQTESNPVPNSVQEKGEAGPLSSVGVSESSQLPTTCSRAPLGVIPSSHAREVMDMTDSTSSCASSFVSSGSILHRSDTLPPLPTTADALRQLPARGLTEEMQAHLSEGFLKLTPEWVPWSEPWAGNAMRATSTTSAAVASSPSCPTATSDKVGGAGSHSGGSGGLHRTPNTSFYCRYPSTLMPLSLSADFQNYRRCALKEQGAFSSSVAICRCSSSSSLRSSLCFASHTKLVRPFLVSSRPLLSSTSFVLEILRMKCRKGELMLATSVATAVFHVLYPGT